MSNGGDDDDGAQIEPVLARHDILVANNALPEHAFPANLPSPVATRLTTASRPRTLKTREDLEKVITESYKHFTSSNFAELSSPQHGAREPIFPTFTRFSSTRFANADTAQYTVEESKTTFRDAVFDLSYPITLHISDGENITIPGVTKGIPDCNGYPLFYSSDSARRHIRSSGRFALYPLRLNQYALSRSTPYPDKNVIKNWAHMLGLSTDKDAEAILANKIVSAPSGDNHIALLVKAYLFYFDSVAGALDGVKMSRNAVATASQHVINTATREGWLSQVIQSDDQIVNVRDGAADYQEFWAYCCFDEPPIQASKAKGAVETATLFSRYSMQFQLKMRCLCDYEAFASTRAPAFYGNPNAILRFIDTYVQANGLQQQSNEALQIAMLWPTLYHLDVNITLPRPLHATDWCGGMIDKSSTKSPYVGLVSSSPFVVLASTLAASWALHSQIYDYITLLAARRRDFNLSDTDVKVCSTWLASKASAPGAGWDFLLRHQFHVTPSFLELTGLSGQTVNWTTILSNFTWEERQFPAHLRLLQPFWVPTSVCCMIPWEDKWMPKLEFVPPSIIVASPGTIMTLLRLGLAESKSQNGRGAIHGDSIYPIFARDGEDSVFFEYLDPVQMQRVQKCGIQVVALCADPAKAASDGDFTARDPSDASTVRWNWAQGGVLQNVITGERGGDAFHAEQRPYNPRALVDPHVLRIASFRREKTLERLKERALHAAREVGDTLAAKATGVYRDCRGNIRPCLGTQLEANDLKQLPEGHTARNDQSVVYSPQTSGDCGWWCVLFLLRMRDRNFMSMACLRRQVANLAGQEMLRLGTLSVPEMAGLCALLDLKVKHVRSASIALCRKDVETLRSISAANLMLSLQDSHWVVATEGQGGVAAVQVNINLMPHDGTGQPHISVPMRSHFPQTVQPPNEDVPHNLPTRARLLDDAIRAWDNGVKPTDEVISLHRTLFPAASIPRFLAAVRREEVARETSKGTFAVEDAPTLCAIERFLSDQCQPDQHAFFAMVAKECRTISHPECSRRWPNRAIENSNKNNLATQDLLRVLNSDIPQEALALWFIWTRDGNHTEFVTSVALWLAALDICQPAWDELLASGLLDQNEDTWLSRAQEMHSFWRKHGLQNCTCSSCWSQLLYTQSLFGRGGVEVDWAKELTNKASAPDDILAYDGLAWSAEYATQLIRDSIREVLSSAKQGLQLYTFDEFMDHAYEWLVAGSAAGMPTAFRNTDVLRILRKQYHISPRPTKRSVMEAIPREHVLAQLESRPQIVAKLHQKLNETGGKARAIYGVTIWHYIFSNWLMAPFEKALDHENIDINIRNDRFLALQVRRAQDAQRGCFFSSYDYPDFNAMHSHFHMSLVYEEASNIVKDAPTCLRMSSEDRDRILKGYKWLRESVFTQVCYLDVSDTFIQTVGGLFSGNRDTTIDNTIFNVAYSRVVDVSCRNLGLDPVVNWRLCHGDDIITQHEKYGAALGWNMVAQRCNLKGQEDKLLTERGFHEYLRVMGCTDGKLRGSLARVIATFVNGNWETDYTPGAHNRVVEIRSSIAVMQRRGMRAELAPRLHGAAVRRIISAITSEDEDSLQLKDALAGLLGSTEPTSETHRAMTPSQDDQRAIYTETARREKLEIESLYLTLPDEVTRPYLRSLLDALPAELRGQQDIVRRLRMLLQRSTYGSEMPRRFQIETKQTPQLTQLQARLQMASTKRDQFIRYVSLSDAQQIVGEQKVFASSIRRIKAFHIVLSALDDLAGYSKTELIAHLTQLPDAVVRNALLVETFLESDWRRITRPSAAEVAALENELEIYLTVDGTISQDEEVVLLADSAYGPAPLRDYLLY